MNLMRCGESANRNNVLFRCDFLCFSLLKYIYTNLYLQGSTVDRHASDKEKVKLLESPVNEYQLQLIALSV